MDMESVMKQKFLDFKDSLSFYVSAIVYTLSFHKIKICQQCWSRKFVTLAENNILLCYECQSFEAFIHRNGKQILAHLEKLEKEREKSKES